MSLHDLMQLDDSEFSYTVDRELGSLDLDDLIARLLKMKGSNIERMINEWEGSIWEGGSLDTLYIKWWDREVQLQIVIGDAKIEISAPNQLIVLDAYRTEGAYNGITITRQPDLAILDPSMPVLK